jgi:hypothetical protein
VPLLFVELVNDVEVSPLVPVVFDDVPFVLPVDDVVAVLSPVVPVVPEGTAFVLPGDAGVPEVSELVAVVFEAVLFVLSADIVPEESAPGPAEFEERL